MRKNSEKISVTELSGPKIRTIVEGPKTNTKKLSQKTKN